jgi:peroxiredoxin
MFHAQENAMRWLVAVGGTLCATSPMALGADRAAQCDTLLRDYEAEAKEFRKIPSTNESTAAEKIHRYEVWPGLRYIPLFIQLAAEKPDDEVAYRCCQWVIARRSNEDRRIFAAEQKAWEILGAFHTHRPELPLMCLEAVDRRGPAQERFLRGLLKRADLPRQQRGYAIAALAELLAQNYEWIELAQPYATRDEFVLHLFRQRSPDWGKNLVPANAPRFKAESMRLFREVLGDYADVPVTVTADYFEGVANLGEKAKKSLHAWEHLTIGAAAPQLVGTDLGGNRFDLIQNRGRVVMVSFWFTGCPGCMHEIPCHQRLLEKYKGRPFALVSVCTDESLEKAKKTAAIKGMNWPCLFDGENGPIAHEWNVMTSPTTYLLDERGVIVAKLLHEERLEQRIGDLMRIAN